MRNTALLSGNKLSLLEVRHSLQQADNAPHSRPILEFDCLHEDNVSELLGRYIDWQQVSGVCATLPPSLSLSSHVRYTTVLFPFSSCFGSMVVCVCLAACFIQLSVFIMKISSGRGQKSLLHALGASRLCISDSSLPLVFRHSVPFCLSWDTISIMP